jgi:hypothetical protein
MFLGLILLPPLRTDGPLVTSGQATVFAMWALGALCISGAFIIPLSVPPAQDDADSPKTTIPSQSGTPHAAEQVDAGPPASYVPKIDDWAGKRFDEIGVDGWPADLNNGPQYFILYSRTCDHCQALLDLFFASPPPAPTTIVAIPETQEGFETTGILEHHCQGCLELELPTGTTWMMTPPLVVALQNGVVQCAAEAVDPNEELPQCLVWHQ